MKIKKVIPIVVSLVMAGGVLAGCAHKHTYEEKWTAAEDGSGHYHAATCHPDEHDAVVEHVYDDDKDTTCNDCGYVREVTPTIEPITYAPLPAGKKIYVVGDSTVCGFTDNYYLPRYGYGTQLAEYLNVTSDQIVNLALSGRSSKSFTYGLDVDDKNKNDISGDLSCYEYLTTNIGEGDYLIIGFGHNDEKSAEAARYTDANGTYTQPTTANGDSFQYILYEKYVKMAADKGATPILCTPIVRYSDKGDYSTDKAHDTTTTDKSGKGGDYAKAIRDLGAATGTTVIDLTALTKEIYTADNNAAKYFHAHTTYSEEAHDVTTGNETPAGIDGTHINYYGAKMVAYQFANALKYTDNTLRSHTKETITAPTKSEDYEIAKNVEYVKPKVVPFDAATHADRNLTGDWYHTVMGNIGGKKANCYDITYSDGKFTVSNDTDGKGGPGSNGKFENAGDGFGAAFIQIDKNKDFKASATVTVKKISSTSNNQSAFGMMLRDDMHIDGEPEETYTGKEAITSNFVSASATGDGSASMLSRVDTTLSKDGAIAVAQGSSYEISIERVGQTVTVKFGDVTKSYTDFDFVAVDNGYMYLCLFANRGLTVEFSNVVFTITGDSQGA